jgi:formylmethanofuran dehydrogenase subunit D
MPSLRLQLHPTRSAQQGVQINAGKDGDEYKQIVTTLSMHPNDMSALGVSDGDAVLVQTEFGQSEFKCAKAKVPEGMIFVPYGPPTCRLMGGDTDGTGMPTSKGWDVDVMPLSEAKSN